MNLISAVGFLAGLLTTVSGLPQAVKILRLKETRDLSLLTYALLNTGILLWLIYGLALRQPPIWAANLISLIPNLLILYLKIKYK